VSWRTDLIPVVAAARAIKSQYLPNQLTIRTRTWSGSYIRQGTATNSDLVLPAVFPIRYMNSTEIEGSAGHYEAGDVLVDHITPSDGAGNGYTPAQLNPAVTTDNVEVIYIITGDHPGEYSFQELRTYRPFTYQLVLRRKLTTP